jgi:hypothetical protein
MSILAQLFTPEAVEQRKRAITAAVEEAAAQVRRETKELLRIQHRALKRGTSKRTLTEQEKT